MKPVWYILKAYVGRMNYTVHLNPVCNRMMRPGDRRSVFPKQVVQLHSLDGYQPCKLCGGIHRAIYEARWALKMSITRCHEGLSGWDGKSWPVCGNRDVCTWRSCVLRTKKGKP